jgi:hypothetical protein
MALERIGSGHVDNPNNYCKHNTNYFCVDEPVSREGCENNCLTYKAILKKDNSQLSDVEKEVLNEWGCAL